MGVSLSIIIPRKPASTTVLGKVHWLTGQSKQPTHPVILCVALSLRREWCPARQRPSQAQCHLDHPFFSPRTHSRRLALALTVSIGTRLKLPLHAGETALSTPLESHIAPALQGKLVRCPGSLYPDHRFGGELFLPSPASRMLFSVSSLAEESAPRTTRLAALAGHWLFFMFGPKPLQAQRI